MMWALVVALSYLLGSLPFGLLVGKAAQGIDIREYGSGKVGTANVMRTLGWRAALLVFAADLLKGVLAVLLARLLLHSEAGEAAAALSAVLGHNWSVFIRFRGGRGVTTSLGGLLTMVPMAGAIGLVLGLVAIALSRYVSLGSILGTLSAAASVAALAALGYEPWEYLAYAILVTLLIWLQHRDNIKRLLSGTERRLGKRTGRRSGDDETLR